VETRTPFTRARAARPGTVAVVLAGAVAQGAFEAGALKVLAGAGMRVARIVAASSGALNGTCFASAVRGRAERDGADRLIDLWKDQGGWSDVFHVSLADLLRGEGLSDQRQLLGILRENIRPTAVADRAPIDLQIVVAPLGGAPGNIGATAATTYERVLQFDGPAFDDATTLEAVFTAAVASASFPLLFAPTVVPGVGPCVDGGAVNNTPIKYALGGDVGREVEAIVLISPTAALAAQRPAEEPHGLALVGQLAEMLINERLYRDLREHEARNAALARLADLHPDVLDPARRDAVLAALGWDDARVVEVVSIRPLEPLPGTAFSGFYEADLRAEYIRIGMERARTVLGGLGWLA